MRLFEFLNEAAPVAPVQPTTAGPAAAKPAGQQPFKPNQTMDPQQAAAANKAAQEFVQGLMAQLQQIKPVAESSRLNENWFTDKVAAATNWVQQKLKENPLIEIGLRFLPVTSTVLAISDVIGAIKGGNLTDATRMMANLIPGGQQLAQAIGAGQAATSGDIAGAATQAANAAGLKDVASGVQAGQVAQAVSETAELDRILKLSGMEFIAEDAAAAQQFVGTGSSKIMSQAQEIALSNATGKLLRQKFGNNYQNQDNPLIYYNQEIKFAADTSKPGNYLATIILTPKEYKLSPGISAKPSMDPNQVLDYFYKGEQIKTTDPFYSKVKQMHIDSLESPAEPATTTNETAELSRLSNLISEDSAKSITVQRGDTLGRIAADNSTTVDALVKLNNIANRDRIYPGDVIKIPGGQSDPGGKTKRQGSTRIPDRAEKLTTTTSTGNPKIAMEFFLDQGWTPEQAAGLVANLQAESYDRIDPAAENGGAYGIAQWRGSRKRDFEEEMGMPLRGSSLMDQLKFVQHELNNKEAKAGRLLKQATTAAQAAEIVDEFYERSGGAAIKQRIAAAKSLLTAFA